MGNPLQELADVLQYTETHDSPERGKEVASAALRIAQRYPDLRKSGSKGLDLFSTTDYIIVARLALGLEC